MAAPTASAARQAQEAFLAVVRAAALLGDDVDHLLAAHGLSQPQYNVLRILRGAGDGGLCRHEIRDRLISRMPDVTRLVDRLEEGRLVARERGEADRRLVRTTITPEGLAVLAALDAPMAAMHAQQFARLPPDDRERLAALLDRVVRRDDAPDSPAGSGCDG